MSPVETQKHKFGNYLYPSKTNLVTKKSLKDNYSANLQTNTLGYTQYFNYTGIKIAIENLMIIEKATNSKQRYFIKKDAMNMHQCNIHVNYTTYLSYNNKLAMKQKLNYIKGTMVTLTSLSYTLPRF